MADFTVRIRCSDEDWAQFAGQDELELSLDARLSEVFDDDGNPAVFHVVESTLRRVAPRGEVV